MESGAPRGSPHPMESRSNSSTFPQGPSGRAPGLSLPAAVKLLNFKISVLIALGLPACYNLGLSTQEVNDMQRPEGARREDVMEKTLGREALLQVEQALRLQEGWKIQSRLVAWMSSMESTGRRTITGVSLVN